MGPFQAGAEYLYRPDNGETLFLAHAVVTLCFRQRTTPESDRVSNPSALVNIILVFGRNNDRNVQRFVNGRFGDRIGTYLCIKINVSNHIRYFSVQMTSMFGPKGVLRSSFYIYYHCIKCLKKFFYDVFGPNRLFEIHKYVHNRSLKRPFTKRCTFRSLLLPKTRIMFTRAGYI